MQKAWVQSLGWKDPLVKGMATHSSILAWRIPWKEEPGRLQSMGLHRVRYDWVTNTYIYTYTTIKSRTHITQSILRMPISWIFSKSEDRVFVSESNSATATVELRPQRKHMDHGVLTLPREVQARSTHSSCLWRKFWSTIPLQQLNIKLVLKGTPEFVKAEIFTVILKTETIWYHVGSKLDDWVLSNCDIFGCSKFIIVKHQWQQPVLRYHFMYWELFWELCTLLLQPIQQHYESGTSRISFINEKVDAQRS